MVMIVLFIKIIAEESEKMALVNFALRAEMFILLLKQEITTYTQFLWGGGTSFQKYYLF